MADGHIHKGGGIVAKGIGIHHQIIKKGIGGTLIMALNHLLTEAALFRRPCQQILIIKRDSEMLRNLFPDLPAPGTELSSDCNDGIHVSNPFLSLSLCRFPTVQIPSHSRPI